MKYTRSLVAVSALAMMAAPAVTGDYGAAVSAPAVSAPNGKIAVRGGGQDGDSSVYGDGAYTIPLGHAYGLQVDGVIGHFGETDDTVVRGAAHLFWRDPSRALLGLYGSATTVDSSHYYHLGLEGQAYLGRLSLEGIIGIEEADLEDGSFWTATAAYYPTDNTRVWAGGRYSNFRDDNKLGFSQTGVEGPGLVGVVGIEHQTRWVDDNRAVALFGEGRFGENDYNAVWGGVRIYFGRNKSLIRRHREDDPATDIPDLTDFTNPPAPAPAPAPPQPE